MAEQAQKTIHIKWVRSGIGFDFHTKQMIRSLGLRRLNHVVERQNTPQIRGLVACIPHFVEIVEPLAVPKWTSVPEYTLRLPEVKPKITAPPEIKPEASEPASPTLGEVHALPPEPEKKKSTAAGKEEQAEEVHAEKAAAGSHKAAAKKPVKHAVHASHNTHVAKEKGKPAKHEAEKKHAKPAATKGTKHAEPEKPHKKGKK